MLKVQMLENLGSNDSSPKRQSVHQDSSPKRLSGSNEDDDCKTPTSSPLHHCHPLPQRQMTTGSIKSASQGSSPAGRQHAFMTNGGAQKSNGGGSLTHSPERLRGATHDLFELLERVQCSRLEDQRCELPAYFSQPCGCSKLEHLDGRPPTQKCLQAMLCFPVCLSTASAIKMFFNTQKSKICHFSQNNASSQQSPKLVMTQFHIADKRCGAAQKRTPFFLPRAVH
uniref:Uncharacterized protein n=1 Tax=Stomoxys calcitrans TaxID=35570 RepID=A0A1I8NUX3_STOCA